jgi:putative phosphoribosyl transferase
MIQIKLADIELAGDLNTVPGAKGLVVFPHNRGTSRGVDDGILAGKLRAAGFSTLLLNLLTAREANLDIRKAAFRFDMGLLSSRLEKATAWLAQQPDSKNVPIGYFGIGYGACAVLVTAANRPDLVRAVVSHDAMPELTESALSRLTLPTLLISGPNQAHYEEFGAKGGQFKFVPGDNHDTEEVAELAAAWFKSHLGEPEA